MPPLEFDQGDFGLGALPSPADPRDFPIELDQAIVLPRRFLLTKMPPVLNQNVHPPTEPLGTCVGHTAAAVKAYEELHDGHAALPFDPFWLYHMGQRFDGIPVAHEGTTLRAVLRVMKGTGAALRGHPETAGNFKIAAYYAVPQTEDAIKRAIFQYRQPVLIASQWFGNWFRPAGGVMPRPIGSPVGGHARWVWGWDDGVGGGAALVRNSWGARWGNGAGSSYDPWRYLIPALHDAWRATDVIGD
jgi:Papain family cysteine protease